MPTTNAVYTVLGVLGSLITASSYLPQIYRVMKRESSQDISYTYQVVFAVGIAMFLAYYGYYQLWAVFFPTLLSLLLMLWLIGLKVCLEEFPRRRRAAGAAEAGGEDPVGGGSEPLGQRTRRSAAAGPAGDSKHSEMQPLMSSW